VIAQEGDVVGVHDPCIIKEGAHYYVFSTHGGIQVRKSAELKNWEKDGEVMAEIPIWARRQVPEAKDLWAPDISFFNGKFHLYYAVSSWGKNLSCIGLATNKTLNRNSELFHWVDEGLVVASNSGDNFNAIDPNVVLDQDGKPWLSFGSFWSGIQIVLLDRKTGKPIGPLLLIAGRDGGPIEAPFIIRKGGYYYLFVSFDQCCNGVKSTYKIMVGRSRRVDGPYLDYTGKTLTSGGGTLVLAGYGRFRGPGHNGVLREGNTDYLVHHFYDGEAGGAPTLQIRPIIWGNAGWPLVGELGILAATTRGRKVSVAGRWQHSVDFESGNTISLLPDGNINSTDTRSTWLLRGSTLLLRWPRTDAPGGIWVDYCFVSPDGMWYVGRNQQGTIIRGVRVP
jgi:arabinan endo-1,5-alpha-L-arabinosidase